MLWTIAPASVFAFIDNTDYKHSALHSAITQPTAPLTETPAAPVHEHDHHMLDFEAVDDAPLQMQQSKTEYAAVKCIFSNAMFPVVQHDRYFPSPVSEIPGPPPKNA